MAIIKSINKHFDGEENGSFATLDKAISVLSQDNNFVDDVLNSFCVKETEKSSHKHIIPIGNLKYLLQDISAIDSLNEKIDVTTSIKNIEVLKITEKGDYLFNLFGIKDSSLLAKNKSDCLTVESRYNAKSELLDYYSFSKFAGFLHQQQLDTYIQQVWCYLQSKINDQQCSARLLYDIESERYYLRAITSEKGYKNYGINFSLLVAILAIDEYVARSNENIFIESYYVDDSNINISFHFGRERKIDEDLFLSLNLTLNNDEIRQSSVSFNITYKVLFKNEKGQSELYIKPNSYSKIKGEYSSDMLTYTHAMGIPKVREKISELPDVMDFYVSQLATNAIQIKNIKNPQEVKDYIFRKVQKAHKDEFLAYKPSVLSKLASIEVSTIFDLFNLFRSVEDLFGDDIKSKDYWREKLYEAIIQKGEKD